MRNTHYILMKYLKSIFTMLKKLKVSISLLKLIQEQYFFLEIENFYIFAKYMLLLIKKIKVKNFSMFEYEENYLLNSLYGLRKTFF